MTWIIFIPPYRLQRFRLPWKRNNCCTYPTRFGKRAFDKCFHYINGIWNSSTVATQLIHACKWILTILFCTSDVLLFWVTCVIWSLLFYYIKAMFTLYRMSFCSHVKTVTIPERPYVYTGNAIFGAIFGIEQLCSAPLFKVVRSISERLTFWGALNRVTRVFVLHNRITAIDRVF